MATVSDRVANIRSKNAGPYWLTIDIFCGDTHVYQQMMQELSKELIASIYQVPLDTLKRFEIPSLNVIKFSFPRNTVQGARLDRDMHGAQMSVLLAEHKIDN